MIRPLGKNILVRFTRKDEVSEAGVLLIHDEVLKTLEGRVISTGDKVQTNAIKHSIHPVIVYFSKFAGQKVAYKGEELIMISEDEILGYEVKVERETCQKV